MRRRVLFVFAALGFFIAAAMAVMRAEQGLGNAERLAQLGLWPAVRAQVSRYLWFHPHHERANLLMAESLIKDESQRTDKALPLAVKHLGRIPDSSTAGASARVQEARLELFILQRPVRAERLLHKAIKLDPQLVDAYYLLWKSMELTSRSHLTETYFWKVYEMSPPSDRAVRLREWYMSQFYPETANPLLEQLMGFVGPNQQADTQPEYRRLLKFRNADPQAPLGHAALARWFLLQGDPKFALQLLQEAEKTTGNMWGDSFFVATLIAALFDLGEFDRMAACMEKWPRPRDDDYEYWRWQAVILDEVKQDYNAAIQAYDNALQIWPGHADWRMRNRKANCLARIGDFTRSTEERTNAKKIERLMEESVHRSLREALGHLGDRALMEKLVSFYRDIGRSREAESWSEQIHALTGDDA